MEFSFKKEINPLAAVSWPPGWQVWPDRKQGIARMIGVLKVKEEIAI